MSNEAQGNQGHIRGVRDGLTTEIKLPQEKFDEKIRWGIIRPPPLIVLAGK